MPRLWESTHTFSHSWDKVTSGIWVKYPNPYIPQVASVDCLDSSLEGGKLVRKRLIASKWELPSWINSLLGINSCYVQEHTEIDPVRKTFIMRSVNISASNYIQVEEICKYSPHPLDPNKTILEQEAKVSVFGISFTDRLEGIVVNRMSNQADKGRKALDHVITELFSTESVASAN